MSALNPKWHASNWESGRFAMKSLIRNSKLFIVPQTEIATFSHSCAPNPSVCWMQECIAIYELLCLVTS